MSQIYNGSFVLGDTSATTISAGPGIKLDTSVPGVIGISNDETVLWEGTGTSGTTINLSESVKNFNTVKFYGHDSTRNKSMIHEQATNYLTGGETLSFTMQGWDNNLTNTWVGFYYSQLNYTDTAYSALTNSGGNQFYINTESVGWNKNAGRYIILDKVIGINRKEV